MVIMDDMNEPPLRYELEILEREMETMKANIDSTLSKMRVDMARQGEESAKRESRIILAAFAIVVGSVSVGVAVLSLVITLSGS